MPTSWPTCSNIWATVFPDLITNDVVWPSLDLPVVTSSYPGWIKSPHVVTCHTDLPKFQFSGGGGDSETEKSKCQDLPKFQFFWGGGYSETEKSKCQDLPKFQFSGEGGNSETEKSKCQDLPKFQFSGGRGVFQSKLWSGKFGPKFTVRPKTCLCITVVSHILRMWRLIRIFALRGGGETRTSSSLMLLLLSRPNEPPSETFTAYYLFYAAHNLFKILGHKGKSNHYH